MRRERFSITTVRWFRCANRTCLPIKRRDSSVSVDVRLFDYVRWGAQLLLRTVLCALSQGEGCYLNGQL